MLILARRPGEKVLIDTGHGMIEVMPVSIEGSSVKLGIEAPRTMRVDREEVAERRKKEHDQ